MIGHITKHVLMVGLSGGLAVQLFFAARAAWRTPAPAGANATARFVCFLIDLALTCVAVGFFGIWCFYMAALIAHGWSGQ